MITVMMTTTALRYAVSTSEIPGGRGLSADDEFSPAAVRPHQHTS